MKKFFMMGVLATAIAVLSQQQASAWTNFKFGVGLNLGYQAGGNNFLWGAWRNGQPPAPDCAPYGCPGGMPFAPPPHAYQTGTPMPNYAYQPPQQVPNYGYPAQPNQTTPANYNNNVPALYRPMPVYNGAFYYPANTYR